LTAIGIRSSSYASRSCDGNPRPSDRRSLTLAKASSFMLHLFAHVPCKFGITPARRQSFYGIDLRVFVTGSVPVASPMMLPIGEVMRRTRRKWSGTPSIVTRKCGKTIHLAFPCAPVIVFAPVVDHVLEPAPLDTVAPVLIAKIVGPAGFERDGCAVPRRLLQVRRSSKGSAFTTLDPLQIWFAFAHFYDGT